MVKLIIWDLDDTLWQGTLAEGDEVIPFDDRINAIRRFNERGIVNSICSKNDPEVARARLEELGLWDLFVFPSISFSPKGAMVAQILDDMQLRAPDTYFVDDNVLNLQEVAFTCEGIHCFNAATAEVTDMIGSTLEATQGTSKSRVEQYRILERKKSDRAAVVGSNEEFLRSCGIKMCVVERTDNLAYAARIEELINRTNQLNFTKSRVEPGSMTDQIIESTKYFTYSAFVWDKYGDYGLVGFASVRHRRQLEHFLFSCRTMNMGIESALASVVAQRTFIEEFPVACDLPDWIELVSSDSEEFRQHASSAGAEEGRAGHIRVMANCQSAAIAHYMGVPDVAFDNYPRLFTLPKFHRYQLVGDVAQTMVYGAFVDYEQRYWGGVPNLDEYTEAARGFTEFCHDQGSRLVVLIPPEDFTVVVEESGQTPERYLLANNVWRGLADQHDHVDIVDIGRLRPGGSVADPRHFDRELLIAIANEVSGLVAQPQ